MAVKFGFESISIEESQLIDSETRKIDLMINLGLLCSGCYPEVEDQINAKIGIFENLFLGV